VKRFLLEKRSDGAHALRVPYRGAALLRHPLYTKGTAFTQEERERLGLEGLVPDRVATLDEQLERVVGHIRRKDTPIEKYIGLASLHDRNEHLFYRVLLDHLEEFLPIVYTPTVGLACQEFSHIFRRARGLWITPQHRGRIESVLQNGPFEDVRLIVVTDNERILGLGDQGAGGMWIPIGKLALYTAAAGIHPARTLPISLDVGTDNEALLRDPLYLGWRQERLRGPDYEALVAEFVEAVQTVFPRALLQWEDFKKVNALSLLETYRNVLPSFNDDVQGTAAVGVAGLLAGARATGVALEHHRVVILGAGAAGVGIARLLRRALEARGVQGDALIRATAHVDSQGLLVADRERVDDHKRPFAWPVSLADQHGLGSGAPRDLLATVKALKPTALIGTAGQTGAFTRQVLEAMGADRPLVFPLSNPTHKAEATPADIFHWTQGRAFVATGSPFDDVAHDGRTTRIGQANNAFIFPGVGLGAIVSEATRITEGMFAAAASELAEGMSAEDLAAGALFPRVRDLRAVTVRIAAAVVRAACNDGVAAGDIAEGDVVARVRGAMWEPDYPILEVAEDAEDA
jgi:malic enzyme